MPKYDNYINSDNKWLGNIPSHWRLKKFKYLASIKKGKLPQKLTSDSDSVLPVYLSMEYLRGGVATQFVQDANASIIGEGEILLLWDGSNSGEFIKSRKGVISSTVATINFNNINKSFAWYACAIVERLLRSSTVGMGIPHVDGDELKNSFLAMPPMAEQTTIANFLDKKTAQIDEAIAIKEKQIELLKERKQIVIQQAVTQGVSYEGKPNAPMKDSGVDWIGEIPEHWQVKKLKYLVKFVGGGTPSKENSDFWGGDICWVSPKDMKVKYMADSIDKITEIAVKKSSVKLLPENTVLIVVRGMILAKKIPIAITTKSLTINQDMKGMVVTSECNAKYLLNLLDGLHEELSTILEESGHGTKTMPTDKLGGFKLPFPPELEQNQIIKFVETESNKFDKAVDLQHQQIEKLKEYKTTLINSAVTGKIKVPEVDSDIN
nr:restriction endonuclease subunit S [Pseudoalteromonas sp. MMG005]